MIGEIGKHKQLEADLSISDLLPDATSKPDKDSLLSKLIQRSLNAENKRVAELQKRQSFELQKRQIQNFCESFSERKT